MEMEKHVREASVTIEIVLQVENALHPQVMSVLVNKGSLQEKIQTSVSISMNVCLITTVIEIQRVLTQKVVTVVHVFLATLAVVKHVIRESAQTISVI